MNFSSLAGNRALLLRTHGRECSSVLLATTEFTQVSRKSWAVWTALGSNTSSIKQFTAKNIRFYSYDAKQLLTLLTFYTDEMTERHQETFVHSFSMVSL